MSGLVLGIDPGVSHCGWAVLDMCGPRPSWVAGGTVDVEEMAKRSLHPLGWRVGMAVVETPVALHLPEANAQLIATAVVAGRAFEICKLYSDRVFDISPAQWRMSLIGRSNAGENQDRVVKRTLQAMVSGMPARTSVHARDAAGAAIVGWRIWARSKNK